jgi:predicted amidohydrolase YtcJ
MTTAFPGSNSLLFHVSRYSALISVHFDGVRIGSRLAGSASKMFASLFILFACLTSASTSEGMKTAADLILYNGKIWTVDPKYPVANAVAVSGSRIIKVGSDRDVLALKHATTRLIDLQGQLVLPGFNDAHTHFENAAEWFFQVRLMDIHDQSSMSERLRQAVERVPQGMWITGGDWDAFAAWDAERSGDSNFVPFAPSLRAVNAITADRPILLRRYDHIYFANTSAFRVARITKETPDPRGGHYGRDPATGELNGMLFGTAGEQMQAILPPLSEAQKLVGARAVLQQLNQAGVTSIQDIARVDEISQGHIFPSNVERSYSDLRIFLDLKARNELTVRVYPILPLTVWSELSKHGIEPGSGDEMIHYGALKDFADGALMFEPYANHPNYSGNWAFRFVGEDAIQQNIASADKAGFDVAVHVIGDKALHELLNWYESAIDRNGIRDRRFRIIHVEYATAADLERAGKMRLIADITPYHLVSDIPGTERLVGPERAKNAFAWRTMIDAGIRLDIVSDLPGLYNKMDIAPFDPLRNMYYAITRRDISATSAIPWHPEQQLTIQEAIEAYTKNPAYASHEEAVKGTIARGKLADLVVLSKDILSGSPEQLLSTKVVYTILGGKVIYHRS